jgi:hypothetical protein
VLSVEGGAIVEVGKSGVEFNPTYNTININNGEVTPREQFFTKQGFQYYNITPVVVPETGANHTIDPLRLFHPTVYLTLSFKPLLLQKCTHIIP